VPRARLQLALDEDRIALLQVLLRDLGQAAPHHDVVPLRLLDAVAVLAGVALGGGDGKARDLHARRDGADVRVLAEVADEHDFVEGCHMSSFSSPPTYAGGHELMNT